MNILELAKTIFIKIFSKIPKLKLLANSKTHDRYCEIWCKIYILQCSAISTYYSNYVYCKHINSLNCLFR